MKDFNKEGVLDDYKKGMNVNQMVIKYHYDN